ncbi:hypothetical protein ONZ45_g812 [Pleurotus djamor]|nr:hypothetical protein ONZ45_g812 [Pleurotus djamor]
MSSSRLVTRSLGIEKDERVIAFGDFNGDQFLDILALGADQQTLQVYLWSHESFYYQPSASFRHPRAVYNVVPGDFTHSGKLDLLVMGKGTDTNQLDMVVYAGLLGGSFDVNNPLAVPSSTLSQPIVVDVNGDMKMDLLGVTPSSRGSSNSLRVWQNTWNSSSPNPRLFDVVEPKLKGTQCTISHPHSNAVVDLNGDCLADIFLVCDDSRGGKSFQVWVNNKEDGFSLAQTGYLPAGTQSITFADMDRDGTLDMVFTTCSHVSQATGVGRDCSLNIAYNKQLPLCAKSTVSKSAARCRLPDELCVADPDFKFDLTESSDNNDFVRMPISKLFDSSSSLLVLDTSFDPPVPLPIRLGDANLDGFPDLLQVIITRDHQTPKLLLSVPCSSGLVGCPENGQGRRSFSVVKKGTESLEAITDAISASFLDMDEDGTLDMMIQRKGSGGGPKVVFVQNNVYYDAFFLKAIVLNGACENGWCYSPNRTIKYHPFGVSYAGATYKYTVLDTSGRRSAAQGKSPTISHRRQVTQRSHFQSDNSRSPLIILS